MRESHIITIAGAGSARVPALVGTLVNYKERFPLSKIIFYDIDNERMGLMEDYDRLVLKCFYPECEVVFTTDEDEAYRETDFVFCQMRVGKTAMRSLDEKIPLRYGLVGQETCGPGGFAYGMRSLGAMKHILEGHLDFKLHQPGGYRGPGAEQDVPGGQADFKSLRPAVFPDEELRQDSGRAPGKAAGQVFRPEPFRVVYGA